MHTKIIIITISLLFCFFESLIAFSTEVKNTFHDSSFSKGRNDVILFGCVMSEELDNLDKIEQRTIIQQLSKELSNSAVNVEIIEADRSFMKKILHENQISGKILSSNHDSDVETEMMNYNNEKTHQAKYFILVQIDEYEIFHEKCIVGSPKGKYYSCKSDSYFVQIKMGASAGIYINLIDNDKYVLDKSLSLGEPIFNRNKYVMKCDHNSRTNYIRSKSNREGKCDLINIKKHNSLKVLKKASRELSVRIKRELEDTKKIISLKFDSLSNGNILFNVSKYQDVHIDETYQIVSFNNDDLVERIGYAKIRDIGKYQDPTHGRTISAELVGMKRTPEADDRMVLHRMSNINFGIGMVTEILLRGFPFSNIHQGKLLYGPSVYIDYGLGSELSLSEIYISFEGDIMNVGNVEGNNLDLLHLMVGMKRKWYLDNWVIAIGFRIGLAMYLFDYEPREHYEGKGGDMCLWLEKFFVPEFSLYAGVAARYFTKSLHNTQNGDASGEVGLVTNIGIRYGL